jgi:hypothetical protein
VWFSQIQPHSSQTVHFIDSVSPVSPRVVWGVGPFLARDALGRKWATQLAGSFANDVLTALQCGGGPDYGCALSHK